MQEPASPLTLQAVPAAPDKSAAPAQAARDVTAHLAAFREFLNASWSCFSALRTQSVWEDNHTLIREFLQANWRVLVESQLLPSGGRLPRYFTCLRPRGPAASVRASGSRSNITTDAPCARKALMMARPMPCPPPVTRATLPVKKPMPASLGQSFEAYQKAWRTSGGDQPMSAGSSARMKRTMWKGAMSTLEVSTGYISTWSKGG